MNLDLEAYKAQLVSRTEVAPFNTVISVPLSVSFLLSDVLNTALFPKWYWKDRDSQTARLGLKSDAQWAEWISGKENAFDHIDSALVDDVSFVFLQKPFPNSYLSDKWALYQDYEVVLPKVIGTVSEDGVVSWHYQFFWDGNITAEAVFELFVQDIADFFEQISCSDTVPVLKQLSFNPIESMWVDCVEKAQDLISSNAVSKLVLARKTEIEFDNPIWVQHLFKSIQAISQNTFQYMCQLSPEDGFISFTPERVLKNVGRSLLTEAVAGTGRVGSALQVSQKDLGEHAVVKEWLKTVLSEHADLDLQPGEPSILDQNSIHHLYTPFKATLLDGKSRFNVLNQLHPTPAVGGYPVEKAGDLLQTLEPFDRGLYAGLIGWISSGSMDVQVAIRCALVSHETLWAFSGAGIVSESAASKEWDELNEKLASFLPQNYVSLPTYHNA